MKHLEGVIAGLVAGHDHHGFSTVQLGKAEIDDVAGEGGGFPGFDDLVAAHRDQPDPVETPKERFSRALQLERRLEAGEPVTADQQRWLSIYQTQPEYAAERGMWEDFGDRYLARGAAVGGQRPSGGDIEQ